MEFLSPWWLAGLVLVPAIFLWGLLAPRGRPVVVGSLMLWRRVLGTGPAGKPSARVRLKDPLLWLDAAAVLLIVLAVARPAVRTRAPTEPVATLVIDRTASMGMPSDASDKNRSRQAQAMTCRVLDAIGNVPLRVIWVPDDSGTVRTEIITAADLRSRSEVGSGAIGREDAVSIAVAEAVRRSDLPVVVSTDVGPAGDLPPNVYVLASGGPTANVGLMRVGARVEGGRWWLLASARAAPEARAPCALNVSVERRSMADKPGFLGPGKTAEAVLPFNGPPPKEVRVGLVGPEDGFSLDDKADLVLEPVQRLRVMLVGGPDPALRRALEARQDTVVAEVAGELKAAVSETDLVVAYDAALPADWKGPAAVILPPAAVGPIYPAEGQAAAEWSVASAGHPPAEALYLEPPRLAAVRRWSVGVGGRVLLGTREAPLVVTWEEGGARRLAVLFGFDEPTTDWPRRAGFPVFWSHVVNWLVPPGRRAAVFHEKEVPGGVSFIGTDEGFQAGPARDDSPAAVEAIRRSIEARRRETLAPVWPFLAAAALAALLARAYVAR